ncbi:MAG: hypothetical protein H0X16_09855, partial [Chloroflexi bacterium]|nr:hypothetical protein [Chloroflexota bacterium]
PSPATAPASPTADGSGFTAQERNLLERVPTGVAEHCRTAPDDALVNATATVRCELPLGSGADTVWWDYFETRGQTILALDRIAAARDLPDEPCGPNVPEGRGEWRVGSTLSGGRLCYLDESQAWVTWTYPPEQILGRAVRTDGDFRALDGWWADTAAFLNLR